MATSKQRRLGSTLPENGMFTSGNSVALSTFRPRAPWWGPDLQTLRNTLRGPSIPPLAAQDSVQLRLPLSGETGDQLTALLSAPRGEALRTDAPLVVLVHGLGGSEESNYMQVTARHLFSLGYAVLQLSLRGAGPSRPLCRGQYHAGRSDDFRDAVAELARHSLTAPHVIPNGIVAVGYSLGGNMLLKYAAEYGQIRGVASISAPIDLAAASHRILQRRNWVYHQYLLRRIKNEALAARVGLDDAERALIPELQTILDFDDRFVAPHNGFKDAKDYYARNSARQFLPEIRIPGLVIHACDDPWIPVESYQTFPWQEKPNLEPSFPRSGGHVGFHASGSKVPWSDLRLAAFLAKV